MNVATLIEGFERKQTELKSFIQHLRQEKKRRGRYYAWARFESCQDQFREFYETYIEWRSDAEYEVYSDLVERFLQRVLWAQDLLFSLRLRTYYVIG